jgi:hypothetical protein
MMTMMMVLPSLRRRRYGRPENSQSRVPKIIIEGQVTTTTDSVDLFASFLHGNFSNALPCNPEPSPHRHFAWIRVMLIVFN